MARVARPEQVAAKRDAILDAAQRLVLTKGYQHMSVQDILSDLQISGGAFHHYFDSRAALLEALIERIQQDSGKPLLSIVHDPHLSALAKLQGFLSTLDRLRVERQQDVVAALRVWYMDANAVARQRVDEAIFEQRAPLLGEVVAQGIREGVFSTPSAELAGEVVMALLQAMGDTQARLLLSANESVDGRIERLLATHAAYLEAIERVLGAPPNSLDRGDAEAVTPWVIASASR
jgi:AcrR family transcriptional regulator